MRIVIIILVAAMSSCASVRTERIAEFKEITKDVCLDNPKEVLLAQHLYKEMVVNGN